MEQWADVVGYEGLYEVSINGEVKNKSEYTLKPQLDRYGYYRLNLSKYGKRKFTLIHRIVALAFLPTKDTLLQVNHINGIKTCNVVSNLEWCTAKENNTHAIDTGLKTIVGESNSHTNLTESDVLYIRSQYDGGFSVNDLHLEFKVSLACIYAIGNRRSWRFLPEERTGLPPVRRYRLSQGSIPNETISTIKYRLRMGDKQSVIAEDTGVNPKMISKIKSGTSYKNVPEIGDNNDT